MPPSCRVCVSLFSYWLNNRNKK
ncbi:type I toxin-antitoxin system Fst family toxin [Enterococcus faecium]